METPRVVHRPALVPLVIEERTTATKSGPGRISAGIKIADTPSKIIAGSILRLRHPGRFVEVHMLAKVMHGTVQLIQFPDAVDTPRPRYPFHMLL